MFWAKKCKTNTGEALLIFWDVLQLGPNWYGIFGACADNDRRESEDSDIGYISQYSI